MDFENTHLQKLMDDIRNNRITLPSLPEVAVKVRKYVDDPNKGVPQIVQVIGTDPALSARLLQVANSPFFRTMSPAENLHQAVARLGNVCVRNIVTSLIMSQLYNTNVAGIIKKAMQNVWMHSTKTASYCHVIAAKFTKLDREQAMVGGLVHNIGALPIITAAGNDKELQHEFQEVLDLIGRIHTQLGKLVLEAWDFPEDLVTAVAEHENLERSHDGPPDYTDVITVGNLHAALGTNHILARTNWTTVPAFAKLGLTPEESIAAMKEANAEISAIRQLLQG